MNISKKLIGCYFTGICCCLTMSILGCVKHTEAFKEDTVLKINSSEVSGAEYRLLLGQEKALTYNYFYQKHGVQKTKDFWETTFDGENPGNFIKDRVNQKLVRIKVIQELSSEMKITQPFSYTDFIAHWKNDNNERKKNHGAGQVVYGPVKTNIQEYYAYLFTNLEIRLKDKLNKLRFTPSRKTLKAYFNQISAAHFTVIDILATEQLSLSYSTLSEKMKRLALVNEIIMRPAGEISFERTAKKYAYVNYRNKNYLADDQLFGEENRDRILKKAASELQVNQMDLIDFHQEINDSIYLVKLMKPIIKSIRAFEDVEKEVLYLYQDEKYKRLIDSLTQRSLLTINPKIYYGLKLD